MSNQVPWTEEVTEAYIKAAMLTETEIFLLRTRIDEWTVSQQADKLHVSESTVLRKIRRMKKKYDRVQAEHPEIFPKRVNSSKELYMDTH